TLNDQIRWLNGGITAASILTHDPFLFDIILADSTQAALSDTLLPLTLPDLSVFTERSWSLAFSPIALAGEQTAVGGRLLSATLTVREVPEPSTLLLLIGAGWIAAALVRCRA
ncbi:MAG: PEP-CTERM sorting domain-containing protein, partial [Alphaproteobacteria bacterium]|nr:PEP-CTERM sorting domain-containing protein [Alphaproteobacteria bacterium]